MSNQHQHPDETCKLDANAVADYLRNHPDFLDSQPELLAALELTHACEGATSLIERQVRTLRKRNEELNSQLDSLLSVARENDRLSDRMHRLTLQLMNARTLDDIYVTLDDGLRNEFNVDAVAMKLFIDPDTARLNSDNALIQTITLSMSDPRLNGLKSILGPGKPLCGQLAADHIAYLFGDTDPLASAALVPLKIDTGPSSDSAFLGVLAIGSRDPKRFQPHMGSLFLSHLGDIVCCAINPHITLAPSA